MKSSHLGLMGLTLLFVIGITFSQVPKTVKTTRERNATANARSNTQEALERRRESFKSGRNLLSAHGVPFDPDLLLKRDWKKQLAPAILQMPEFKETRKGASKLEGVQIADALYLPEKVELTGDTVILSNQLLFAGKNAEIKGPHDLHIFILGPVAYAEFPSVAVGSSRHSLTKAKYFHGNTSRIAGPVQSRPLESLTIRVDGEGRDEWLQKKKALQDLLDKSKPGFNHHALARKFFMQEDGSPGADGNQGSGGLPAGSQPQAPKGNNGSCNDNANGGQGTTGYDGLDGGDGGNGQNGQPGGEGHVLNASIDQVSGTFSFSAHGGKGGQGGRGGDASLGGTGGKGGDGGDGADCGCGRLGDGGRAAPGGPGGGGNTGGTGGDGKDGGPGGEVNLTIPCDFYGTYSIDVDGGQGGQGGGAGSPSNGGQGGDPGSPGRGATDASCTNSGATGQSNSQGAIGSNGFNTGTPGASGSNGAEGNWQVYDDETDCDGGGGDDCKHECDWDWDCECDYCDGYSCQYIDPILIDISGRGFDLTDAATGVTFDFFGHGSPRQVSWTAPGSDNAWLVLDRNGNEKVDNGEEMFSNVSPQPPPQAGSGRLGFLALALYDQPAQGGNGDGIIDSRDAVFGKLRLWQDVNHNGISEPGELHTLPEMGVESLSLDYKESRRNDRYGNVFRYRTKVHGPRHADLGRWAYDVVLTSVKQTPPSTVSLRLLTLPGRLPGGETVNHSWRREFEPRD